MKQFPILITVAVMFGSEADGRGDLTWDLINFAKSLKDKYPNIKFSELADYDHYTKRKLKGFSDGGYNAYLDAEGGL